MQTLSEVIPKTLNKEQERYYDNAMSSYPAFAKWTQDENPDLDQLAAAFRYELERDHPRWQVFIRIIQLYNARLSRVNREEALALVRHE